MIKADEWRGGGERIPWNSDDDAALDAALEQGVTADAVVKGFRSLLRAADRPERSIRELCERGKERGLIADQPLLRASLASLANAEFMPPRAGPLPPPSPERPSPALRSMPVPAPPLPPKANLMPEIEVPDDEWQSAEDIGAMVGRNKDTVREWSKRGLVKRKATGNPNPTACQWLYSVKQAKRQARVRNGGPAPKQRPPAIEAPPLPRPQAVRRTTALEAHIWAERDAGLITDAQALDMLRALRGGR